MVQRVIRVMNMVSSPPPLVPYDVLLRTVHGTKHPQVSTKAWADGDREKLEAELASIRTSAPLCHRFFLFFSFLFFFSPNPYT